MKIQLLDALKSTDKKSFINDLMAGLLVAIIALPLSIALGIQSGATLQQGIITAIVAGFFISSLGGSKFQIGGPTAAFVVIILGYISNPDIGFFGLQIATILAGVILILLGIFKIGKYIKFMPYPIVIGFTTGIGITLFTAQLKDFFGLAIPSGTKGDFLSKIIAYFQNISSVNIFSACVGIITLLVIFILPKINKKIPSAFAAIIFSTLLTVVAEKISSSPLNIATIGSTYGDVKATFSFIDFSLFSTIKVGKLIIPSIIIAFLCAIESLLSATVADGMTKTTHDSNQELFGQGVANICSSCLCGLPATGAIARTAASIDGGASSPLAGVFHAVFLLVMYLVLMPVVKFVPLTSLAAVLISVSIKMANFPLFIKLFSFTKRDAAVLATSCLLTVFFDLTYGVIGGFALTVIINIQNIIKPVKITEINFSDAENGDKYKCENKKIFKVEGSVYFISVNKLIAFTDEQTKITDELVLDMSSVKRLDLSSVEKLAKQAKKFAVQGKRLVLHGLNEHSKKRYIKSFEQIIKKG